MAPGSALDASQNAADLVFSGEQLGAVSEAFDVARAARARALENFGFAALYNLVAAPAAMLGLVNPFVAALAMSGSSLVVTLNALRLRRASQATRRRP
jgi:Cu2+-exporting ATPase